MGGSEEEENEDDGVDDNEAAWEVDSLVSFPFLSSFSGGENGGGVDCVANPDACGDVRCFR